MATRHSNYSLTPSPNYHIREAISTRHADMLLLLASSARVLAGGILLRPPGGVLGGGPNEAPPHGSLRLILSSMMEILILRILTVKVTLFLLFPLPLSTS